MTIEWKKMPLNRRRFMQGASALGLAAALPAGFPRRAMAADGSTLRTRGYADMRTLDPAFSQGVVDEEIQSSIYNKLIQYKPGREWDAQLDAADMVEQVDPTHIKFALARRYRLHQRIRCDDRRGREVLVRAHHRSGPGSLEQARYGAVVPCGGHRRA